LLRQIHCNAKAKYASPDFVVSFPPPPAAITTNCLPLTAYVQGVAYPPAGSLYSHKTFPFVLSKARNFSSFDPPTKTNPPAVTIVPPRLSVPVCGTPRSDSSAYSPKVVFQLISPRFTSIAFSSPHGGLTAG